MEIVTVSSDKEIPKPTVDIRQNGATREEYERVCVEVCELAARDGGFLVGCKPYSKLNLFAHWFYSLCYFHGHMP